MSTAGEKIRQKLETASVRNMSAAWNSMLKLKFASCLCTNINSSNCPSCPSYHNGFANRLSQNNWQFSIVILVSKPTFCSFSDWLYFWLFGIYSGKPSWLVSTKSLTRLKKLSKTVKSWSKPIQGSEIAQTRGQIWAFTCNFTQLLSVLALTLGCLPQFWEKTTAYWVIKTEYIARPLELGPSPPKCKVTIIQPSYIHVKSLWHDWCLKNNWIWCKRWWMIIQWLFNDLLCNIIKNHYRILLPNES